MSMSSAERKCNEEGDGHKLDFMISVDINGDADKFETLYGLFKHPNILCLYGRFCEENHVFLILEYGAMEKFINILESVPDLPKSMCQGFVIPPITVAHALIYLHHKKIIHQDIKPENLLLGLNNDLKIADFGWSVHTPEMVDGLIHGSRADLWILGVLCYELLFRTVPFSGPGGCKVKDLSDATSSSANTNIGSSLPSLASSSLTIQEQAQDIYEENEILSLQSELSEDFPINGGNDFYDNISSENQNTNRTNQEFDEQVYDGNEKQNYYSGDTGPYFPNFTIFLLFLWVTKHQIDVPFSLTTIKKYHNGLPLLPFKGHTVTLNNRNMPSTFKSIGQALIFPLKNILHCVLSNPELCKNMYFGPGIHSENGHELWHGDLWQKSPLFGEKNIKLNHDIYIKIECILEFNSLPSVLKSKQRKVASCNGHLWMTDKTLIINPINIKSKYVTIQDPPHGLPVLNFFLDIYIDKFGPFRNAYHAIGGIYLQIGNMKQVLHQKLKNHFLLGFIPFTATSDKVLQPLIDDIQELEHGYKLKINNQHVWVTGGLGVITSDLPEGNEQAGIKNHNAHYGCHNCMIHHNNLHDITFDISKHGRYHHKTTLQFAAMNDAQTQIEQDFLATEYAKEMLQKTFEILSTTGEDEFLKIWHNFELPSTWACQQNPITHLGSYFFSNYLHLSMIMPFLINRAISTTVLNKAFIEHLIKSCATTKNHTVDQLLSLWVSFSKMAFLVFRKELSETDYNNLQQSIMTRAVQVTKVSHMHKKLHNQ
ncbi:13749_t:CDS:2 [Entrophospora sp. SA101]|nr:13749_t:CDS:2 [Entrophospora sp. SA101]